MSHIKHVVCHCSSPLCVQPSRIVPVPKSSFLYHLLNNLIIDQYRKRKTYSLDMLLEKGYEIGIDDSERLAEVFDGRIAFRLVDQLPKRYQNVLYMKYADHLSYGEISRRTGQERNTIAVQVHRGLAKLKQLYTHRYV